MTSIASSPWCSFPRAARACPTSLSRRWRTASPSWPAPSEASPRSSPTATTVSSSPPTTPRGWRGGSLELLEHPERRASVRAPRHRGRVGPLLARCTRCARWPGSTSRCAGEDRASLGAPAVPAQHRRPDPHLPPAEGAEPRARRDADHRHRGPGRSGGPRRARPGSPASARGGRSTSSRRAGGDGWRARPETRSIRCRSRGRSTGSRASRRWWARRSREASTTWCTAITCRWPTPWRVCSTPPRAPERPQRGERARAAHRRARERVVAAAGHRVAGGEDGHRGAPGVPLLRPLPGRVRTMTPRRSTAWRRACRCPSFQTASTSSSSPLSESPARPARWRSAAPWTGSRTSMA